ncbi:hypothetical protein JCM11491_003393 [Sporobolomyces phaffii]
MSQYGHGYHQNVDPLVKYAYLEFLKKGREMLGSVPGLQQLPLGEVEIVPDAGLSTHFQVPAYRASGDVVRGHYIVDRNSLHPSRPGKLQVPRPYTVYTRRMATERTGRTAATMVDRGSEWRTNETAQSEPVDAQTGGALPKYYVYPRAMRTFVDGSLRTSTNLHEVSTAVQSWIQNGRLQTSWPHRAETHYWTQLPSAEEVLDLDNVWASSSEVYHQLEIEHENEIVRRVVICFQIARRSNGTYVPWKASEEQPWQHHHDYDHNSRGLHHPSFVAPPVPPPNGAFAPDLSRPVPQPPNFSVPVGQNPVPPPPDAAWLEHDHGPLSQYSLTHRQKHVYGQEEAVGGGRGGGRF